MGSSLSSPAPVEAASESSPELTDSYWSRITRLYTGYSLSISEEGLVMLQSTMKLDTDIIVWGIGFKAEVEPVPSSLSVRQLAVGQTVATGLISDAVTSAGETTFNIGFEAILLKAGLQSIQLLGVVDSNVATTKSLGSLVLHYESA